MLKEILFRKTVSNVAKYIGIGTNSNLDVGSLMAITWVRKKTRHVLNWCLWAMFFLDESHQ